MKKFLFALPLAIGLCLSACSESSSTAAEDSEGGSGGSSVNGGKLVAGASTMVDLDTLEFENCGFDLHKDISFAAHYLKVSDSFYAMHDGMLKSQLPAYRIKNVGDAVIVVNQRGDSLFYEGEP